MNKRTSGLKPKTYHATDHDIDPNQIDPDAITTIDRLRAAGYEAYLVGGSVRDLLVKKQPKDFDISTSAKPEEIKDIFKRQCLLIGRRFRLAHIRYGRKIFEVSTFRSGDIESNDLIVSDNIWGTAEEDVLRRDFTINGLFYDPQNHQVIDYVGGWNDIHHSLIRTIGPAQARFQQDPVRMIRLLKFQARFDFSIDAEAQTALNECRDTIVQSAPARILEEMLRMMESGATEKFMRLMHENGILSLIFPWLAEYLGSETGDKIFEYVTNIDTLHQGKHKIDRSVLLAALIYPILKDEIARHTHDQGRPPHLGQISELVHLLLRAISDHSFCQFTRRLNTGIASILITQYRITPLSNKVYSRSKALTHRDFPLALDFLKIRSMANPDLSKIYSQWNTSYQQYRRDHPRPTRRPPRLRR